MPVTVWRIGMVNTDNSASMTVKPRSCCHGNPKPTSRTGGPSGAQDDCDHESRTPCQVTHYQWSSGVRLASQWHRSRDSESDLILFKITSRPCSHVTFFDVHGTRQDYCCRSQCSSCHGRDVSAGIIVGCVGGRV